MRSLLFVVLCCLCVATTVQGAAPGLLGVLVNFLFDQVLKAITLSGALDPLSVPNTTRHFEANFIIKVDAKAGLYNGQITGLSTMHRTGNCHVSVGFHGVEMGMDVGAGPVRVTYTGEVKLMYFTQSITIVCDVNSTQIAIEAVQNRGKKPELKQFKVHRLQGVRVKVQGLGPLGWLASTISSVFTSIFEEQIRHVVQENVRTMFAEKLAQLDGVVPNAIFALG